MLPLHSSQLLKLYFTPKFTLPSNSPMSTINQYGSGDKISGDKVMGDKVMGDKIDTQINNSQNLI